MTLYVYLLGPIVCKIVAGARMQTWSSKLAVAEPGQKWRFPHWVWEYTTESRGEGGPAALTDENRPCVLNSVGEDPLVHCHKILPVH